MGEIVLTDRELDVMNVLWDRDSGTVAEVRDALDDELAYTTVLTVLRTLEEKGYAEHEKEGRAHRYHPLVQRSRARESALRRMTRRLFSGSPELLLAHLVEDEGLDEADLARIRRLVSERLDEAEPGTDRRSGEGGR